MTTATPDPCVADQEHTIGMPDLQFMEVDFLKPTAKNPKSRDTDDTVRSAVLRT